MPIMDGIEATEAIREGRCGAYGKTVPIVATTAFANSGDREKFLKAGMNHYLSKPVDSDDMRAILTEVGRKLNYAGGPVKARELERGYLPGVASY